jgi:hypothetical protein
MYPYRWQKSIIIDSIVAAHKPSPLGWWFDRGYIELRQLALTFVREEQWQGDIKRASFFVGKD